MRRIVVLVVFCLALACVPGALANAPQQLTPTSSELAQAERVARTYWGGNPPCGAPTVLLVAVLESPEPLAVGEADIAACVINLRTTDYDWRDFPVSLCETVVHEWGHLVLGATHFAAVNPSDPAHSPDPHNIMAALVPSHFRPCEPIPPRIVSSHRQR